MPRTKKKRHVIIRSLRLSGLTYAEVRNMGFDVSKHLWHTCLDESERNLGRIRIKGNILLYLNLIILKVVGLLLTTLRRKRSMPF